MRHQTRVCFTLLLLAGCSNSAPTGPIGPGQAKDATPPNKGPNSPTAIAVDEEPEVAAYFKNSKQLKLVNRAARPDQRFIFLTDEDPKAPSAEVKVSPEDLKMIARLKTAQAIALYNAKLTDDEVKMIINLPQLQRISLQSEKLTDAALKEIGKNPHINDISLTSLTGCQFTDAGIEALAELKDLRQLNISGTDKITGTGFKKLAHLQSLNSIILYCKGVNDESARALALLPNLTKSLRLEAESPGLTAAGLTAIADRYVPADFKFDKHLIDDGLLKALVAKGWLYGPSDPPSGIQRKPATAGDVKAIDLNFSKITDEGFKSLLPCQNLETLQLVHTMITDATLLALGGQMRLEMLFIPGNKISGKGMEVVAALPVLNMLKITNGQLSEDVFKALAKSKSLKHIEIEEAKFDEAWIDKHLGNYSKQKGLVATSITLTKR